MKIFSKCTASAMIAGLIFACMSGYTILGQKAVVSSSPSLQINSNDELANQWLATPVWATGTWGASDAPFNAIVAKIDKEAVHRMLKPFLLLNALKQAKTTKNPVDAATAAYYQFRLMRQDFPQDYTHLYDVTSLLRQVPDQHSRQFSRIAFLVTAYTASSAKPWLPVLGDRLLQHNETDTDLVYARVRAGGPFVLLAPEKAKMLGYANHLVATQPEAADSYLTLAFVYDTSFTGDVRRNRQDGVNCVAALNQYQQHSYSPADRQWAKEEIAWIDELMQKYSK